LRTTIKDVAKRAGVSTATVSLALNDPKFSISKQTRDLVIRVAEELNYRPNQVAVSLVKKRTNIIGLIFPDNVNTFYTSFSHQFEEAALKYGYSIIVGTANDNVERVIHYLHNFVDHGVDGIILTQSIFRDEKDTQRCLEAIAGIAVPIILTNRVPKTSPEDMVLINNSLGGYIAMKHLIDLGHRRIGIISGSMFFNNSMDRLAGCKKALEEAGIPFDDTLVYKGDNKVEDGMNALPYMLDRNVTAIFAFNDMMAYGIYKESQKYHYHLTIPRDLSVVGFDGVFFSDIVSPPLTTIEYPIKSIATAAIDRLVQRINGMERDSAQVTLFDPMLKINSSTRRIQTQENTAIDARNESRAPSPLRN